MQEHTHIFVRLDRCLGCHSCELACAVAHSRAGSLQHAIAEVPKPQRRIFVEGSAGLKAPLLCRHCEDAPCAHICPSAALSYESTNGTVQYDKTRCIGCSLCLTACPFGVIQHHHDSKQVIKCDRCIQLETPACVAACPTHALQRQTSGEFASHRRRETTRQLLKAFGTGQWMAPTSG
jgi:anaerobic carbon-monoxide dehydrogenase iron sulfur subunit